MTAGALAPALYGKELQIMIDTKEVTAFFDRLAPVWDEKQERDEAIIKTILEHARIEPDTDVLDVACGTGVLIPDYLARGVRSVTGVDLSSEMAAIARNKFRADARVAILCADAEEENLLRKYDRIVIYDALPHFRDPERLIAHLSAFLKPQGFLTVAHDRSREQINLHHKGMPAALASDLMPAEALAETISQSLAIIDVIDTDRMYLVTGQKR